MSLTSAQQDRAAGVMLGTACGDALGAGYEFGPPLDASAAVTMKGGGGFNWAPGEWTDDTSMAVVLLQEFAMRDDTLLDRITARWENWAASAPDVGIQTRSILRNAASTSAADVAAAAAQHLATTGRAGGNGSLMRTAPLALFYLNDTAGLATMARTVSDLTHPDPEAGDACVMWTLAIRHAVLTGENDLRGQLAFIPEERRDEWMLRIDAAERLQPRDFDRNGWVVHALQGAWSAIHHGTGLVDSLERAVRGGRDTDTVAAIAGGLLGARWGASAVPFGWRRIVHGWPGLTGRDLTRMAIVAATGARPGDWPSIDRMDYSALGDLSALVKHPYDDGLWIGAVGALDSLPPDVDVVVSLCRLGQHQVPRSSAAGTPIEHVEIWLVDNNAPASNPNLDLVLLDAVDSVAQLRAEGKVVLLHCVQAQSRTPSIAALYAARHLGEPIEKAMSDIQDALPEACPKQFLVEAAQRLTRAY